MSNYVDGFVLAVKKDRLAEYKRMATKASKIWREHGALDYWECAGDDMEVKGMVAFPKLAKAKEDEVVIFAWVVFASRQARDKANKAIMADERLASMMDPKNPPFDCKKMAYGGFKVLVH